MSSGATLRETSRPDSTPFAVRTIGTVVAVAVAGFAAFLLLSAYAPDLRSGHDGAGHALSTSAIGFEGVVDLARRTGATVALIRDERALRTVVPVVATPGVEVTPKAMRAFLAARRGRRTLIVLPKWSVRRLTTDPAWVEQIGTLPEGAVDAMIHGLLPIELCRSGTEQNVCGPHVRPVLAHSADGAVLARIDDGPLWVLADPDYLDNRALATLDGARTAMQILQDISFAPAGPLAFDLTLNGFGRQPNLLKLAFEPPFLALTLCLLAAAALAALQASVRFGAPEREARAVAFGKRALADNIAVLLRRARRAHPTGAAYAALVAEAAGRSCGSTLSGPALIAYLDGLGDDPRFSVLAAAASEAHDEVALLAAAKALHRWKDTKL